jgi:phosphate starvation-inducible protein PhoH
VQRHPDPAAVRADASFLPGDLAQKVDPYLRPLYAAVRPMGLEKVGKAFEKAARNRAARLHARAY